MLQSLLYLWHDLVLHRVSELSLDSLPNRIGSQSRDRAGGGSILSTGLLDSLGGSFSMTGHERSDLLLNPWQEYSLNG